jgi:acetyl-CoA synthetase
MTETQAQVPSLYPPPEEFAANANATAALYDAAEADRLGFWAEQANRLAWQTPFSEVLDWSDAPFAKWFVGGRLNVAYNCVDRHVEAGNGDRVAIYWEGAPVGDSRTLTYADLQDEVCWAANALTELGLEAGDRVAIYMPMIPEAIVAMLACARLGALHSVVFAGFSGSALRARIEDAEAKPLITTDGQYRRGKAVSLKEGADEAVRGQDSIEHVLVVRRTGSTCRGQPAGTSGGTKPSARRPPSMSRRRLTPSTRCSCSTPPAPPASRRASCTPPEAS